MNPILTQSPTVLKGIGNNRQQCLQRLGIESLWDLLLHLPFRYEDRSTITPIQELKNGQLTLVQGWIDSNSTTNGRKPRFDCCISDASGSMMLRFFQHYPGQQQRFASGLHIRCFGTVRYGSDGLEFVHPDYQFAQDSSAFDPVPDQLSPVYPLTQGISQQQMRLWTAEALLLLEQVVADEPELWQLPSESAEQTIVTALAAVHFPSVQDVEQLGAGLNDLSTYPERKRLAAQELAVHTLHGQEMNQAQHAASACKVELPVAQHLVQQLFAKLPFLATNAQSKAIDEVLVDLSADQAMSRLLQGDVGSGKTLVAASAALAVISAGQQAVMMVPTELLAEQHAQTLSEWFADLTVNKDQSIQVVLLKGGLKAEQKQQVLEAIHSGRSQMIVGTHALLQEQVQCQQLGLIIIDEQHRFGVEQRALLKRQSQHTEGSAHQLIMTATPIPRTLAMLQFADLDVSILDELPANRLPVETIALSKQRRQDVIQRVRDWVAKDYQAYWVCTVIEESDLSSREAIYALQQQLLAELPEASIAVLHGKMKAQDKQQIMQQFRDHQFDVLLATTVIEVGVDVPNANLMVIEDAHLLGLAQLHQLRGRVGRGSQHGYCVLLYQPPLTEIARQRVGLLRECHDGFVIAEKDLELRGPGELSGLRQSGALCFRVADLAHDQDLLEEARHLSTQLLESPEHYKTALRERWLSNHDSSAANEV